MLTPNEALNINEMFAGAGVRWQVAPLTASLDDVLPAEREAVARAVEKRQREFATGRVLARSLLGDFGVHGFCLLNDADRVPVWPDGFVGSIAHCDSACAVTVSRTADGLGGLGVDLEPDAPLEEELWEIIATPDELVWTKGYGGPGVGRLMRLIYCAKEAVYKSLYPTCRRRLTFQEVELEMDVPQRRFAYRIQPVDGNGWKDVERNGQGRWSVVDRYLFTTVLRAV